jgi:8-oxo-dGTP diphosphatase
MWDAQNSEGYEAPVGIETVAAIFALVEGELSVLLARRQHEPQLGAWALPGGFSAAHEPPHATAARKLDESTGVAPGYLEQLYTYAEPGGDERGWLPTIAYLALITWQPLPNELAQWVPLASLPELAFNHATIVHDARERMRGKLWYSRIAAGLLPPVFSLSQARAVYNAVSGQPYDPANFRRSLLRSGFVSAVEGPPQPGRGRPATLYRFAS